MFRARLVKSEVFASAIPYLHGRTSTTLVRNLKPSFAAHES
jgi:hypothetical protein